MEPHKLKVAQEAANILIRSGVIRISESPILTSNLCLVPQIVAGNIRDSSCSGKVKLVNSMNPPCFQIHLYYNRLTINYVE